MAASLSFIHNEEDVSDIFLGGQDDNLSMMMLYQDAISDHHGEKCQLQLLWVEEKVSPSTRPTEISHGFVSHDAKGQAMLCIMNETEGMLTGLAIKDLLLSRKHYPTTGFQLTAKQALPIYHASRPECDAADILLLDHQNRISLYVDSQVPKLSLLSSLLSALSSSISVNKDTWQYENIRIQDPVDNRFTLVVNDKCIKRCQVQSTASGILTGGLSSSYHKQRTTSTMINNNKNRVLLVNSHMALRCAWSNSYLWFHFQAWSIQLLNDHQYQDFDRTNIDEWQVFVTTLFTMIPLSQTSQNIIPRTRNHNDILALYTQWLAVAYDRQQRQQQEENDSSLIQITDPQDIAYMIYGLHFLHQDYTLSKLTPKKTMIMLGTLLWVLSCLVQSDIWIHCYEQYVTLSNQDLGFQLDSSSLQLHARQQQRPIDDMEEEGLIRLARPFFFESCVRYQLPHDYTLSLQQQSGMPTLDPMIDTNMTLMKSNGQLANNRKDLFGFKLKMIWYIHQTMHYYLRTIANGASFFFTSIGSSSISIPAGMEEWVSAIVKMGYSRKDLDMVPDSCVLLKPLLDALDYLQLHPPTNQSIEFYSLIGRYDMVAQLVQFHTSTPSSSSSSPYDLKLFRFSLNKKLDCQQDVHQLMTLATTPNMAPGASQATTAMNITKQQSSFVSHTGSDLVLSQLFYGGGASTLDKLRHVRSMLNPCRLIELNVPDRHGLSEAEIGVENQNYLKHLIQRTLALSIGNGIFHYGHHHLFQTSTTNSLNTTATSHITSNSAATSNFQGTGTATPNNVSNGNNNNPNTATTTSGGSRSLAMLEEKINLSAKLLPMRMTITLDEKTYRPEYFDWPRFHHGVATGLRLSSPRLLRNDQKNISSNMNNRRPPDDSLFGDDRNDLCWLFYAEPEELNIFHGGVLFGLGLNGHLLPNLHWYRYITQAKCSLVTIGFILGICVTFRGSKNLDITKILSVHVPALLSISPTTATATGNIAGTVLASNMTSGGDGVMGGNILPPTTSSRVPGADDLMPSSCLFGLGLIFMGSCDRYMTIIMLNEIGNCSKRANTSFGTGNIGGGNNSGVNSGDPSLTGMGGNYNNYGPASSKESACALAAGFALGFIVLGKGGNTNKEMGGLSDLQLADTLQHYMTGQAANTMNPTKSSSSSTPSGNIGGGSSSKSQGNVSSAQQSRTTQTSSTSSKHGPQTQHYARGMSHLLDITAPAATIALGLIYLKTENHRVAERIDICETTKPYLNYVRPDFLLMRVVAKNLILWNSITPTQAWIYRQMPSFMRPSSRQEQRQDHEDISDDSTLNNTPAWEIQVILQAKYNIIAGACLCLGLRFAGSHDIKAFKCLLNELDTFMHLSTLQVTTFQEHITRSAIWICIDVIASAAAMVMAGSGHEELYERLKKLHQRVPFGGMDIHHGSTASDVPAMGYGKYGNHMASHMAMGMLFCGLGRYTLKTSNDAIAGLLCAFYPFYPTQPEDQRYHLQAFRHLWVMALDQRWLTPVDCDTKQPCQVPLLFTTSNTTTTTAPSSSESMEVDQPNVDLSYKDFMEQGDIIKRDHADIHSGKEYTDASGLGEREADKCLMENADDKGKTRIKLAQIQREQQEQEIQRRVVAPSVIPSYESLTSIQLEDSSLYYPINVNMQNKNNYRQAICQSGILFVQRKRDKMKKLA
ncbi:uncharacterized protein BX664DRAFT_343076 [Halteromyces radiatus]|uniref:uncharacterized protein n=1 Tax=Halteromyces radiatus TaxID=101107 RepID=UPI00221F929A|nr:uncharacterized protein BX664DRAFT_343076 [Halteromyces radiatus]KAI8078915.1 hypothetical protein BX664DRAFT_343076 [Halteromyces radiatus]